MHSLSLEQSNEVLHDGILGDKPFMAGRFGLTEATLLWYTGVKQREPSGEVYRRLSWGVGLFPVTKESIRTFINEQMNAAIVADAMLVWNKHSWEEELFRSTTPSAVWRLAKKSMAAPFVLDDPWTAALAGKKVLVVHPFAETIERQHAKQKQLDILPEFDLELVEAPLTVGPQKKGSWLNSLNWLKLVVETAPFDVALVACGGYGMPLAKHIRSLDRKVIVVGGTLQLLFGIKGKRWDGADLYNEHWVRPAEHEHPKGYKKIEGGCYW